MNDFVNRVMAMWDDSTSSPEDTLERFRQVYADPARVNGVNVPVAELAGRAVAVHRALADRRTVVHDIVEGDGFMAVAFDIHARHVGPGPGISTSTKPRGRDVVVHGMDIFHLDDDGKIGSLWAVNDQSDLIAEGAD